VDNILEVYEVGTKVALTDEIEAKIVTVAIHAGNAVQYECAWWNGESRMRDWFVGEDFTLADTTPPLQIGFGSFLKEQE